MSKKISTIFLSLFLIGILSVSCSNSDKTGAGDGSTTTKGIEQFNNNSYVSESAIMGSLYLWVSVKDSKVGTSGGNDQTSEPQYQGYFSVTGSGTDYSFSTDYYGQANGVEGTLKFAPDGSTVTVNYRKNPAISSLVGKDIVCNKK